MALIGFQLLAWSSMLSSGEREIVGNTEGVCCHQERLTSDEARDGPGNYATPGDYVAWCSHEDSALYDVVKFPFYYYSKTYPEYCEQFVLPAGDRKVQESAMLDYLMAFSDVLRTLTRYGGTCSVARFLVYEGYEGCALRIFHCSTRLLSALEEKGVEFEFRPTIASEFYADKNFCGLS